MPPHVDATVLAETLVVKPIGLRNLPALVVASNQRYPVGVADLQRKQQEKSLDRVEAAVYKIAHEQVARPRALTANPEKLHQVVKLAMDVATARDW